MVWQRKIPFGYQMQGGELRGHPEESTAVRAIFELYLAGDSYQRIAGEMMRRGIFYHPHTPKWNKHMVKRILENEKYLGADGCPKLVETADFLAVRRRQAERAADTSCPPYIEPVRKKAVCGLCGAAMARDTKSRGRPRWQCQGPACGHRVTIEDQELRDRLAASLRELAQSPHLLAMDEPEPGGASLETMRLQNELKLALGRGKESPELIRALIFAAAASRYDDTPDPTRYYQMVHLRERLEQAPAAEETLQELLSIAVRSVRIGWDGSLELELVTETNARQNGKERMA